MQDRPVTAARPATQSYCWVQMRSIHECGPSAATALTGKLPNQLQHCIMQQAICNLLQSYSTFDLPQEPLTAAFCVPQVLPLPQHRDCTECGAVRDQLWHGAGRVPAHHGDWTCCTP